MLKISFPANWFFFSVIGVPGRGTTCGVAAARSSARQHQRGATACRSSSSMRHQQGRSQEVDFFIIRGTNHTNLYKNLIKI